MRSPLGVIQMRKELIYVEMVQDASHSGPAWIGYGLFNKTGKTVYFNGKVFGRGKGIIGNHVDIEEGHEYWISGVKKNGKDRHWAGSGKVHIDKSVVQDYLKLIGETTLPKNKFILTELNNVPNKDLAREIENIKLTEEPFDRNLLFKKKPKDLTLEELKKVMAYYNNLDLTEFPLKSRKLYIETKGAMNLELESRINNA